jgi:hypothetical protein
LSRRRSRCRRGKETTAWSPVDRGNWDALLPLTQFTVAGDKQRGLVRYPGFQVTV